MQHKFHASAQGGCKSLGATSQLPTDQASSVMVDIALDLVARKFGATRILVKQVCH
jgi:hypothetical protein